jgi:SAM-dependent methyltransferase
MNPIEQNKQSWDRRTEIHLDSEFYDVKGFLSGKSTLNKPERDLLGNVDGKSLLHLQCHFGLDTLSFARLGAKVTGVDLSSTAVNKAADIAVQAQLDAKFICSDVLALREQTQETFDLVYTSYGVLCWLPDLTQWGQVVADSLKSGGRFHIIEFHPFHDVMAGYDYFHDPKAIIEEETTYTENCGDELQTIATWAHSLSDVLNALIKAGLVIEQFNEYDASPYDCFDGLTENAEGQFQMLKDGAVVPMMYSISARKP